MRANPNLTHADIETRLQAGIDRAGPGPSDVGPDYMGFAQEAAGLPVRARRLAPAALEAADRGQGPDWMGALVRATAPGPNYEDTVWVLCEENRLYRGHPRDAHLTPICYATRRGLFDALVEAGHKIDPVMGSAMERSRDLYFGGHSTARLDMGIYAALVLPDQFHTS
jgi:hypothetical protein